MKDSFTSTAATVVARHGAAIAAVVAICASAPALSLPFMSDDWVNLATVAERMPLRTAFGYFRPLYLASYWAELHLWGLRPVAFHLTNLFMIAACAAMVVLVIRQFTRDPGWTSAAGILFALHPYHVENAAWIAARADIGSTGLVLASLLAYERWTHKMRGLALSAIAAFEAALLFKESVVFFPVMVIVLRILHADSGVSRKEWLKGILPLGGTALAHFLVLRRVCLGDSGLSPLRTMGPYWIKRGADFFSAAVVPFHAERIEAHPFLFAALALSVVGFLALLARSHFVGRVNEAGAFILLLALCLAPSLLSFQERYFFLPSAVTGTALAFLLLRTPKRIAPFAWIFLLTMWIGSLGSHWYGWLQAGRASEHLIADLTEASHLENVREIVVANQPYRVAGAPLAGDLSAAVRLSGGRNVRVSSATSLNLPNASASGIEGDWGHAIEVQPGGVELRIRLPQEMFSGVFLPLERPPNTSRVEDYATLAFDASGGVTVTIPKKEHGSRVAYAWYDGTLKRLF